jgi:hypothetical protein
MQTRRIWHFENLDSWQPDIWQLLLPHVDCPVIEEFQACQPKWIVSDDLSWLEEKITKVKGYEIDIKEYLATRLLGKFDVMRAYHGARPVDSSSYFRSGLLPMNPKDKANEARAIFLSSQLPEVTLDKVNLTIAEMQDQSRVGRVFFQTSKHVLEEDCAQYMLYGSEFMVGVAAALGEHIDYRQILKKSGTPTVFVCDVPLKLIEKPYLLECAGHAIQQIFERLVDSQDPDGYEAPDVAIVLSKTLLPKYIVDHYHPPKLKDPLLSYEWVTC